VLAVLAFLKLPSRLSGTQPWKFLAPVYYLTSEQVRLVTVGSPPRSELTFLLI
jgi:hypothetical protein